MRTAIALMLACLAVGAFAPALGDENEHYLSYSGVASERRSQQFLYGEKHFLLYSGERLAQRMVLYTCRDGTAFARKSVIYSNPVAPDFALDDAATGMREGVHTDNGQRAAFFRANRSAPQKDASLAATPGLVIDAGFDEFIRAQWDLLAAGKPVQLRFLVPSRLSAMRFLAQRVRSDSIDGEPSEVIRLKLDSVLGVVLPSIDVTYRAADRVLLRYDGISDLRDRSGNNLQALISFPPGERTPGTAQQFAAAAKAPLADCRR